MLTLLIFLAVLSVLVLSHEWGHFIVARRAGMKVEEFGFGFPPRLFGIRRVVAFDADGGQTNRWQFIWGSRNLEAAVHEEVPGTVYSFNILPLGGFVKIKGENSADEGGNDSGSFAAKKAWQKIAVLVAGVAMNIIVAVALLSVGYMIGAPQNVEDRPNLDGVTNHELRIVGILDKSPAAQSGLIANDIIRSVDALEEPRLHQLQEYIDSHRDQPVKITVERRTAAQDTEGQHLMYTVTPTMLTETSRGGIGVALAETGLVSYPWYRAAPEGVRSTKVYLFEIVKGLYGLVADLFAGRGASGAVAGPVGIAVMTGAIARLGLPNLLQFMALLSLNLAVLNILPIPALDGGRLLFVIIGKIFRRRIAPRAEQLAHSIGFVLLMLLVVVVTVKDLGNFKDIFVSVLSRIF